MLYKSQLFWKKKMGMRLKLSNASLRFRLQKEKENKTLFYGWMGLPSSIGQSGFFDPKSTTKKILIRHICAEKFLENILTYFQKFSAEILDLVKKWLILQDFWEIIEQKICQNGKFGSITPVKSLYKHAGWKVYMEM